MIQTTVSTNPITHEGVQYTKTTIRTVYGFHSYNEAVYLKLDDNLFYDYPGHEESTRYSFATWIFERIHESLQDFQPCMYRRSLWELLQSDIETLNARFEDLKNENR